MTTTYAVKGTARTAEGDAVKTYTSRGGTQAEAEGMLAELQDVQQGSGLPQDAEIVALADTIPAEVVHPGEAMQRINLFNRDGSFDQQVRIHGTEAFARDWVSRLVTRR